MVNRADARRAAEAYRATDRATKAHAASEPLWLPVGWLAVVMMLTSAAPSLGAESGWRARGSSSSHRHETRFRPVDYQSDIAGPVARVANRSDAAADRILENGYRIAQQGPALQNADPLREMIERPFGLPEPEETPAPQEEPDDAGSLFDDLPEDPFDEPMMEEPADEPTVEDEPQDEWTVEPGEPVPEPTTDLPFDLEPVDPEPAYEAPTRDTYVPPPVTYDSRLDETRAEAEKDCAEELAALKAKRLDTIDLEIGIAGVEGEDFPFICSVDDGALFEQRDWAEITYMWKASALCHKPLYFEDVHLERYGHSWGPCVQPIISGAHFFGRIPVLPYCMGLKAPNECVYALGHYRPGNCAPYMIDPVPFTWRAALYQTGGVFGVAGFLP